VWSYSNGASSTVQNPAIVFNAGGNVNAQLVVGTDRFCYDTTQQLITVPQSPTANFSVSNVCLGQTTSFSNSSSISTPNFISGYSWNFGDNTTSIEASPTHFYSQEGLYSVSLVAVADNGCADTLEVPVGVSGPPVPDFTFNRACANASVQFTDLSTSTYSIASWAWDFGDGSISTAQNPLKTYSTAGTYNVTLCTSVGGNCDSCITKQIVVLESPLVSLTNVPVCQLANVNYSANIILPALQQAVSYFWQFGDGGTAVTGNTNYAYANAGTFSRSITVTTDSGCIVTSSVQQVVLESPNASFTWQASCGTTAISFTDNTSASGSPITGRVWDFSGLGTDTASAPVFTFPSYGSYSVTLTLSNGLGCSGVDSQTVSQLFVGFNTPDTVCMGQEIHPDIQNVSNFVSADWDFCSGELGLDSLVELSPYTIGRDIYQTRAVYDGTSWYMFALSSSDNVLYRLDYGSSINQQPQSVTNLGNPGSLLATPYGMVVLKEGSSWYGLVTNNSSLIKLSFGSSLSNIPTATTVVLPTGTLSGARKIDYALDNDSLIAIVVNSTTRRLRLINFGSSINNSIQSSDTITSPQLTNVVGVFGVSVIRDCSNWVAFIVGTSSGLYRMNFGSGLFDSSMQLDLVVSSNQFNDVRIVRENGEYKCFVIMNGSSSRIYYYGFGGSATGSIVSQSVRLIPNFNGRSLSVVNSNSQWSLVAVEFASGLVKHFNVYEPCSAAPGVISGLLPNAEYLRAGSWRISVAAKTATGAILCNSKRVTVRTGPVAAFGYSGSCATAPTLFIDSSIYSVGFNFRQWSFSGLGTSSVASPTFTFPGNGTYNVSLVLSGNGCSDTVVRAVRIYERPYARFVSNVGCQRDSAYFSDITTFVSDTINTWSWDFAGLSTSNVSAPTVVIDSSGSVPVRLQVTNIRGCIGDTVQNIFIKPKPRYNVQVTNTCVGQLVRFTNNTTVASPETITSTFWDLGDNQTSSQVSPVHQYPSTVADYRVVLYNNISNGCSDSAVIPLHISTRPTANFTTGTVCQSNPSQFIDLSVGASDTISQWIWSFGDNGTSSVKNPLHVYTSAGSYNVRLVAVSPTFCSDTIVKQVRILPSPQVTINTDTVCLNSSNSFANQTTIAPPYNVVSWQWNFGDNQTSNDQLPTHTYATPGYYRTTLVAVSDSGCFGIDSALAQVRPLPSPSFALNRIACAQSETVLSNFTTMAPPTVVSSYLWNFGDNTTDTVRTPVHTFPTQGDYLVTLTATSEFGCSATTQSNVEIFAPLVADFSYSGTCLGDTTRFIDLTSSLSVVRWQWTFGDFSFPSTATNPNHRYAIPDSLFTVVLQVENAIGCIDTEQKQISIVRKPVANFSTTPVCVGTEVNIADNSTSVSEPISQWRWNVSGISYTGNNVSYTFADTGLYPITLKVSTPSGCSDSVSRTILVSPLPRALFDFNPQYGEAPLDVTFINQSSGAVAYQWSFGDGDLSSDANPVHTYIENDTVNIQLTAISSFGCTDSFARSFIVVPTDLDLQIDRVTHTTLQLGNGVYATSVNVKMSNQGTRVINSARLFAKLGDGTTIVENWSGTLPTGQSINYTFTSQFVTANASSRDYVCVNADYVNNGETESRIDNNGQCVTLTGSIQLSGPNPNPAFGTSEMGIILPEEGLVYISILDVLGNYVVNETAYQLPAGRTTYQLPVHMLRAAEYFIRIRYNDDKLVRKLIVGR